jgi:hypothetical protein
MIKVFHWWNMALHTTMSDIPVPWQIQLLRSEIADLSAAIHQLRRCGLDSASAELLIAWKRAELDGLMRQQRRERDGCSRQP